MIYQCLYCPFSSKRKYNLKVHEERKHRHDNENKEGRMGRHKQISCKICSKMMRSDHVKRHMHVHEKRNKNTKKPYDYARSNYNKNEGNQFSSNMCDKLEQRLGGLLKTETWRDSETKKISEVLEKHKDKVRAEIGKFLQKKKGTKFQIILKVTLQQLNGEDMQEVHFSGESKLILDLFQFDELYKENKKNICKSFHEKVIEGSGWLLESVDSFILRLCQSSYHNPIVLS